MADAIPYFIIPEGSQITHIPLVKRIYGMQMEGGKFGVYLTLSELDKIKGLYKAIMSLGDDYEYLDDD